MCKLALSAAVALGLLSGCAPTPSEGYAARACAARWSLIVPSQVKPYFDCVERVNGALAGTDLSPVPDAPSATSDGDAASASDRAVAACDGVKALPIPDVAKRYRDCLERAQKELARERAAPAEAAPIDVTSADGVVHEFPAGTDPAVIDRVMKDYEAQHPMFNAPAAVSEPVAAGPTRCQEDPALCIAVFNAIELQDLEDAIQFGWPLP